MKTLYQRVKKYNLKNPESVIAKHKVFIEKRAGRIKNEPCIICGNGNTQAHHENYSKPLEIVWLCKRCHTQRHIEIGSYKLNGRLPAGSW